MRNCAVSAALLLLALALLYAGLNVAERSMAELLARDCEPGAFIVRSGGEGKIRVTFSGHTFYLDPGGILIMLKEWWETFSPPPRGEGLFFYGKILDKSPAGWYFGN